MTVTGSLDNEAITARLDEIAELLAAQDANPFRVRAYRVAAATIARLERPVADILRRKGITGFTSLPGIGTSLAHTIARLAESGRLELLERLRGAAGPVELLMTVPGVGAELAKRVHDRLGIEDLHELEIAAHDGRLATVPGFGRRRVRAVRESLAGRFRRDGKAVYPARRFTATGQPPVSELLDVDREYRKRAAAGRLPRITPRRFNPAHENWLPILHTHRGDRHYTALFSNTARAHELHRTHDWVVIYRDDDGDHGQWTVVTARAGPLKGRRIVRGREDECARAECRSAASEQDAFVARRRSGVTSAV